MSFPPPRPAEDKFFGRSPEGGEHDFLTLMLMGAACATHHVADDSSVASSTSHAGHPGHLGHAYVHPTHLGHVGYSGHHGFGAYPVVHAAHPYAAHSGQHYAMTHGAGAAVHHNAHVAGAPFGFPYAQHHVL
ncbi:uncharacterized protein LOC119104672 [Pollicipes pollicipes]|uniref:uncharacterized protein LOC119104672 n=1 Tax=Pollicipes pollicipes TaxID=41117 RepID=UPI0018853D7E|nr:uncharacterized protein LOC119104672 [Pollicipes pollicipes]